MDALWLPTCLVVLLAACAASAWLGFCHARRAGELAPAVGDPSAGAVVQPGFWCDLQTQKGMTQMARVVAGLPDASVDALWQTTRGRVGEVRGASSDLDRMFFLANRERERRAQRRALAASSCDAKRILRTVLDAGPAPAGNP